MMPTKIYRNGVGPSENEIQAAFFDWLAVHEKKYPAKNDIPPASLPVAAVTGKDAETADSFAGEVDGKMIPAKTPATIAGNGAWEWIEHRCNGEKWCPSCKTWSKDFYNEAGWLCRPCTRDYQRGRK